MRRKSDVIFVAVVVTVSLNHHTPIGNMPNRTPAPAPHDWLVLGLESQPLDWNIINPRLRWLAFFLDKHVFSAAPLQLVTIGASRGWMHDMVVVMNPCPRVRWYVKYPRVQPCLLPIWAGKPWLSIHAVRQQAWTLLGCIATAHSLEDAHEHNGPVDTSGGQIDWLD